MAWDFKAMDIKQAIMAGAYQGKEVSCDNKRFVQKSKVTSKGTAAVDWSAPPNSKQAHWHFVFKSDADVNVIN